MKYVLLSFGFFLVQNVTKLIYRTSLSRINKLKPLYHFYCKSGQKNRKYFTKKKKLKKKRGKNLEQKKNSFIFATDLCLKKKQTLFKKD